MSNSHLERYLSLRNFEKFGYLINEDTLIYTDTDVTQVKFNSLRFPVFPL